MYEFQTSAWLLNVENFEATFATGTTSEFTITYKGIAPAAGNGRTFRLTMLLPSCALGAASSAAISPVAASGTVPASAAFRLASKLDVNMDTIRDSGYYSDSGVGKSNIAFCAKMEILEGAEVKVDRLADINVELDMGQEFQVTDFISRDPTTGKVSLGEPRYHFLSMSYFKLTLLLLPVSCRPKFVTRRSSTTVFRTSFATILGQRLVAMLVNRSLQVAKSLFALKLMPTNL